MTTTFKPDDVVLPKQQTLIALSGAAKRLASPSTRVKAARAGQRISQFKGRGMELDEARPYQPGDDIRSIDWKVTARTQKTHTKVFRQERERPVHVWVDNRTSMQFGTKTCYKSVLAARIAALLAWNAIAHSDRVGGMVFSEQDHHEFRPKMGRSSVLQLIHLLSEATDKTATEVSSKDVLDHAIFRLRHTVKPGSLVYLVSDFSEFDEKHKNQIAQISRHNDVALIHIFDSIEQTLPPSGTYSLQSLAKKMSIKTNDEKVRLQFEHAFIDKQSDLKTFCQKHQCRFLSLATHQDPVDFMSSWLKQ